MLKDMQIDYYLFFEVKKNIYIVLEPTYIAWN